MSYHNLESGKYYKIKTLPDTTKFEHINSIAKCIKFKDSHFKYDEVTFMNVYINDENPKYSKSSWNAYTVNREYIILNNNLKKYCIEEFDIENKPEYLL